LAAESRPRAAARTSVGVSPKRTDFTFFATTTGDAVGGYVELKTHTVSGGLAYKFQSRWTRLEIDKGPRSVSSSHSARRPRQGEPRATEGRHAGRDRKPVTA
jgi:hypothetical protein